MIELFAAIVLSTAQPLPVPSTLASPAVVEDSLRDKKKKLLRVLDSSEIERARAVNAFAGIDTPEAAEVLVDLYLEVEKRALPIEAQRAAAIQKGNRGAVAPLRAELDPLRDTQEKLLNLLKHLSAPDTLDWLFEHVVEDKKAPHRLRLVLTERASKAGHARPLGYVKALDRASKPGDLIVALYGIAGVGTQALEAAPKVIKLLGHKEPGVRHAAAWAAASLAVPESIEPLIEQLAEEEGRGAKRFAAALEVITRQKLGLSASAWRRWFADHGDTYTSGGVPLGGGETSLGPDTKSGYFHGIPQEGHSIVYVIDVSGSMRESVERDRPASYPGEPAPPGTKSRLELCKEELIKALEALPEGTKFNIVHYAYTADLYTPKLIEANPKRIKKAVEWVQTLRADGATNIYDGLQRAFELAGRGTKDAYYDAAVETVFLLTDGRPQLPDGQWDDTNRIAEAVQRWNPLGKVVVHAIGMGKDVNQEFLKRVAEENGGKYVQRD